MTTYEVKQHDTAPSPRAQLLDGDGDPVALAGATVKFKARASAGATLLINATATVEAPIDNNGELGWVHYTLVSGNTAQAGAFLAEWEADWGGGNIATFPGGDEYDLLVISPDLDAAASAPGTGYCTRSQAREAGCTGDDATVDAYIAAAEVAVDDFTQEHWRPDTMTVVASLSPGGLAQLPRQIDPASSILVTVVGASTPLPSTSYMVTSSRTLGQVDAIRFDLQGSDPIIAGAEPWNGGWAGLLGRYSSANPQLTVQATFGRPDAPVAVALATALLAAHNQASGTPLAPAPGPQTDDEGNTVVITTGNTAQQPLTARTTGLIEADILLAPLRRRKVRFS